MLLSLSKKKNCTDADEIHIYEKSATIQFTGKFDVAQNGELYCGVNLCQVEHISL